jgi:hypothetical protein
MKCNINNTGYITGTQASFNIQYATEPIALAGMNQTIAIGNIATIFGSAASNSGKPVTYTWTLTSKPAGSQSTLSSSTIPNPTITPDVIGTYVMSLIVNDGTVDSAPATVTVTAQ